MRNGTEVLTYGTDTEILILLPTRVIFDREVAGATQNLNLGQDRHNARTDPKHLEQKHKCTLARCA